MVLTPLYVKTLVSSGLGDSLACAEVCHDALVDLARQEAFEAADDLAFGPAIGSAAGDVVTGGLVESHADDDGSKEGGVGLPVAAAIDRRQRNAERIVIRRGHQRVVRGGEIPEPRASAFLWRPMR